MKYYCIGIKGSGMAALACILKDLGNEVSGYDDDTSYTDEHLSQRQVIVLVDRCGNDVGSARRSIVHEHDGERRSCERTSYEERHEVLALA